jgi:hypothetical protein
MRTDKVNGTVVRRAESTPSPDDTLASTAATDYDPATGAPTSTLATCSPVILVWLKRRWRCGDADCPAGTWTEDRPDIAPTRSTITRRAGVWATTQVGRHVHSVWAAKEGRSILRSRDGLALGNGNWARRVAV